MQDSAIQCKIVQDSARQCKIVQDSARYAEYAEQLTADGVYHCPWAVQGHFYLIVYDSTKVCASMFDNNVSFATYNIPGKIFWIQFKDLMKNR